MEQQHQAKAVAAAVETPASSNVSVADGMANAAGQQLNGYSKG
jgi:hypothetical protein